MADHIHNLTLDDLRTELERIKSCSEDNDRLGADKLADRWEIRQIFVAASRRYHPDLHCQRPEEFRNLSEEIFMLLSEAERRLRRTVQPGASRRRRRPMTRAISNPVLDASETTAAKPVAPAATKKKKASTKTAAKKPKERANQRSTSADVPPALLRRMGLDPDRPEASKNPRPESTVTGSTAKNAPANDVDTLYGNALYAMLETRYKEAADIFVALLKKRPKETRYHTALELARGHLARDSGQPQDALEHFHRVCVLDGSCADAISAIQALTAQGLDDEDRLLDRLLGDGR